jgi:processing peptidase subunit beta
MASRRLALNLAQGLRGRAGGLSLPTKRGLATPHSSPAIKTETTTLKNGLTVSYPPLTPIDQLGPRQAVTDFSPSL